MLVKEVFKEGRTFLFSPRWKIIDLTSRGRINFLKIAKEKAKDFKKIIFQYYIRLFSVMLPCNFFTGKVFIVKLAFLLSFSF